MESRALANPQRVPRIPSASPAKRGFGSVLRLLKHEGVSFPALKKALRNPPENLSGAKEMLRSALGEGKLNELILSKGKFSQGEIDNMFSAALEIFVEEGNSEGWMKAGEPNPLQRDVSSLLMSLVLDAPNVSAERLSSIEGNERWIVSGAGHAQGSFTDCSFLLQAIFYRLKFTSGLDAAEEFADRVVNAEAAASKMGVQAIKHFGASVGFYMVLNDPRYQPWKRQPQERSAGESPAFEAGI
ncbi:hypothetical protein JW721_03230 [Candidatus Micrarchaeota archaeon]|nr:hypothetical protein [Candidatus Micrarchaeota archaeon]